MPALPETPDMPGARIASIEITNLRAFHQRFDVTAPLPAGAGQWMVFLTYDKSVTGHPENKNVSLRLMSLKDVNSTAPNFKNAKITVLAKLFGGQGTINVPSWSPDSKQLAFVSYQMVPKESM